MTEEIKKVSGSGVGSRLNTILLAIVLGVSTYLSKLSVDNHTALSDVQADLRVVNKQLDSKSFVTHPELDLAIANVKLDTTKLELQIHELSLKLQQNSVTTRNQK